MFGKFNKIIIIFIFALGLPMVGFSQSGENLAGKIDKLRNQIVSLYGMAQKYQDLRSIKLLDEALEFLSKSSQFLEHHQIPMAWGKFARAKKNAELASKLLLLKSSAQTASELETLLSRAEQLVNDSKIPTARYMLSKARAFQKKSDQAYRDLIYLRGQEFQRIALYYTRKTIQLCEDGLSKETDRNRYEEQFTNLRQLYQDISGKASSEDVKDLLQKAESFLNLAERRHKNNNIDQAMLALQMSERLLFRAIDLSQESGSSEAERIMENLASLDRYITEIESDIASASSMKTRQSIQKAREFYLAAQNDVGNARYKSAYQKIQIAQKLATKSLRSDLPDEQLEQEPIRVRLDEVERLLQMTEDSFKDSGNPKIKYFMNETRQMLIESRRAYEQDHPRIALRKLQLAARIINRLLAGPAVDHDVGPDPKELQDKVVQLHQSVTSLKNNATTETKPYMDSLQNMLDKVSENISQNNLDIASEWIKLIEIQIKTIIKEAVN